MSTEHHQLTICNYREWLKICDNEGGISSVSLNHLKILNLNFKSLKSNHISRTYKMDLNVSVVISEIL